MPYSKINSEEMILRDHLAYDRTILANERTMLAYLRTSITLLAGGITLIKFFPEDFLKYSGFGISCLGGIIALLGAWRFFSVMKKIGKLHKEKMKKE